MSSFAEEMADDISCSTSDKVHDNEFDRNDFALGVALGIVSDIKTSSEGREL